jgi:hypothetical protein
LWSGRGSGGGRRGAAANQDHARHNGQANQGPKSFVFHGNFSPLCEFT